MPFFGAKVITKSTTERHFSRKNHNILQLWFWEKKDFMKRGRGWRGGALFVTILWILFSQIPFLLYEGYPYFFVWKGGRFLPNLKCPHYTVSSFVTTGGGAQWAPSMHPVYGEVCQGRGGVESYLFCGGRRNIWAFEGEVVLLYV